MKQKEFNGEIYRNSTRKIKNTSLNVTFLKKRNIFHLPPCIFSYFHAKLSTLKSYIRNDIHPTNTMKQLYCIIVLAISFCNLHANPVAIRDSLLRVTKTTKDLHQKANAYRNLADYYFETPEELNYLKLAYEAARQANDQESQLSALSSISNSFIRLRELDSARYYMRIIEKEVGAKHADAYLSYLRMKIFDRRITQGKEEAELAMKDEFDVFENADKSNIYIRIEKAYVTGNSLFENNKYHEAIPYLDTAYKLAKSLPFKIGHNYVIITGWVYGCTYQYTKSEDKVIELIEEVLNQYQTYYDQYYAKERPLYPIHLYKLQCYSLLLSFSHLLSIEKANDYLQEIRRISPIVTDNFDKYNCFLAICNYSRSIGDLKAALIANDSLIKYIPTLDASTLPELYLARSILCEKLSDLKNALLSHKLYAATKDSLSSILAQEQLSKLQVQYDVDKLTYEKARLENKNKQILLITLGIILILTISSCAYLYFNLKREQRMKKRLRILNEKAEESEKLKTAFLNSMCHEIRTPLNAIVGFSGIIVDDTIDMPKEEFYNEIVSNTNKLTTLIDHLLEVANLDSSEEMLPCEITDIKGICQQEMEKAKREGKAGIHYQLDFPQEDILISTNDRYLALAVENLLNNANKFTEKGTVTLKIVIEVEHKRLQIAITDTGCGIPLEKQEVVFERFTKLDSFTQGNGLGLYLCRLVIKRLYGTIYIDPAYTNGTRFVINLPM